MSAPTSTAEMMESMPSTTGPPPIAVLLPLLQHILAGSALLLRVGVRFLLTLVSPIRVIWSIARALLFPIAIVLKVTLDFTLFTPFSIVRTIAVALYPIYVFCAAACILGATVGIFGHYVSTALLSALSRTRYFSRRPSPPPVAAPVGPPVSLRKRKRRSVRMQ